MVFVSTLLFFSLIVLFVLILLNIAVNYIRVLSPSLLKNKFFEYLAKNTYLNIIYIYILLFFLAIHTTVFNTIAAVLFVLMSYSQRHLWLITLERKLTTTPLNIRKPSLERLLSENCTITHFTFHKYLYDLLMAQASDFKTMITDSIQDIKVAFYLVEPNIKLTQAQKDLYNLQKKYFKYKKVDEFVDSLDSKSDEEVMELYRFFKRARDPKERFNSVRRLPWKLKYNTEQNLFFQLCTSHILVIYNFFKSTLVAVLLMLIYFLYTVFFF